MSSRKYLLWTASAAIAILLIYLMVKLGKLNFDVLFQQLRSVTAVSLLQLTLLTGLHVFLSTQKWRSVDQVLRRPSDAVPPKTLSFALTSIGVALGQLLPVQLSMSIARTIGTYLQGGALRRGTGGTLFEQSFDVLVVVFLAVASVATRLTHGSGLTWILCATGMIALAMIGMGPMIDLVKRRTRFLVSEPARPRNRLMHSAAEIRQSGLLDGKLARKLMALSATRFAIQALMAGEAARAIGVSIPLWQLAAAMPFVILACVIVVTPAGLGVNELSYASALHMFGTPINVGAQWAFANRFLVASSCFMVAAFATALLGVSRIFSPRSPLVALEE